MIQALTQRFIFSEALRTNRPTLRTALLCAVVSLTSFGLTKDAIAEDAFVIRHAETSLTNKVYQLSANMDYKLNDDVREAIDSGVPLIMVMDIELYKPRKYVWDKEIAELQQRYKLQYHALAEQYIVTNINSGEQQTYHALFSAIESIRDVHDIPIIDAQLLNADTSYNLRLRVRLELSSLPVPLRLTAYLNSKWRKLGSEWYSMVLNGNAKNVAQDSSR